MWRYSKSRNRNTDLEPVPPAAAQEPRRTTTGQPESPRCHYFEPGSYRPPEFDIETRTLHGFQPDRHALSGSDQQILQRFARDLKNTFETYPESFVTVHGAARPVDTVVDFLTAAEVPADKLRPIAHDPCSCTVELKLFKRNLSHKAGNSVNTKLPDTGARPAPPPFATLPGKIPGESDEYRTRTKEDSTIAAILAGLHRKQAELPKGARIPTETFTKGAQQVAKAVGLPDWMVEKARNYASQIPTVGLQTVLEHIEADRSLDDRERAALRRLVTALPQITE